MSQETGLTEHEKHNLNALKLFLERSSDLKVLESGKVIDALSPEKRREVLGLYDRALKNPQVGDSGAHNLPAWLSVNDTLVSISLKSSILAALQEEQASNQQTYQQSLWKTYDHQSCATRIPLLRIIAAS